jgi:hypothetical protein
MRSTTRRAAGWLALALLLAAGCQRLNDERTVEFDEETAWKKLTFDPPRYEQKVNVTVSSPGAPLTAWLVKTDDAQAVEDALGRGKAVQSALAHKEKAEDISLEATVPANTGYTLYLVGTGKKTDAKVKVVGR